MNTRKCRVDSAVDNLVGSDDVDDALRAVDGSGDAVASAVDVDDASIGCEGVCAEEKEVHDSLVVANVFTERGNFFAQAEGFDGFAAAPADCGGVFGFVEDESCGFFWGYGDFDFVVTSAKGRGNFFELFVHVFRFPLFRFSSRWTSRRR